MEAKAFAAFGLILIFSLLIWNSAFSASIFTVVGTVRTADDTSAGLEVIVSNETRKLTVTTTVGKQEAGRYSVVFIDTENKAVAAEGDVVKVTIEDAGQTLASVTYHPTGDDIAKGRAIVNVELEPLVPVNQPPVASFVFPPESPAVSAEITFDASAAYDPDGQIIAYEWDFGDGYVGNGKVVTHSYSSEGGYTVTLMVRDNDGATAIASEQIKIEDVSKLKDIIDAKLFQRPIYPPYLLDTDSFSSAVTTIWQNFTDWFRREDLTDNYDELYFTGIEYDSLRYMALIRARSFLESGDIANAEKYLEKADTYEKLSYISFQGASYVFEANLEVAATIAQSIKDGCQTAVTFGLRFANPTAAEAADFIYDVIDLGIEYYLGDQEKAVRDFLVKQAITEIFNKVQFEELGGKTIAEWTKNRTGKYLFPTLSKLTKSEKWQWALSKVIKEGVGEITEDKLIDITNSIADEAARTISSLEAKQKSPVELRVYDSQERVTGLVNGEVKGKIPGSVYDNGRITIFFPADVHRYEVVGTSKGEYGLEVTLRKGGETTTFSATNVPTSANALHRYTINWDALSKGDECVTIEIDENGDLIPERTVTSDKEFTQEEYLFAAGVTPEDKLPATWADVKRTALFQNYPNPFNPDTWMPYQLVEDADVNIKIYSIAGQLARTLHPGPKPAGSYINKHRAAYWDGRDESGENVASGIYFYTIQAGNYTATKKMVTAE